VKCVSPGQGHQMSSEHTRRVDEEEAAVDTGVGNIAVAHGGQLLAEVGRMLVLSGKSHSRDSQITQKCTTLMYLMIGSQL